MGITKQDIIDAMYTLRQYKQAKTSLENRVIEDEEYWKGRHLRTLRKAGFENTPATGWLFNSIINKHADVMENYPIPIVLPQEESDTGSAELLSSVLPVILDSRDFITTWSDAWYDKLKYGTAVYGVFWNGELLSGLGDIDVRRVDILNIFWEPGIMDIQKSRNVFCCELRDNDILVSEYPELEGSLSEPSFDLAKYMYDTDINTSGKSVVIDWYYKKRMFGKDILHYCKFVNETVLYSSENDEEYCERGYYDHGRYPFVFDKLFVEQGTPCGYGYIDVMRDTQDQIDKLSHAVQTNALQSAIRRWFIRGDGKINEQEMSDWMSPFVHYYGSGSPDDNIKAIDIPNISQTYVNILNDKIHEIKEITGNRDFSQGGTSGGVVAASAIAALQETGTKLSRDMLHAGYNAFREVNLLMIELVRQFYSVERTFRITEPNGSRFIRFGNRAIASEKESGEYNELKSRMPYFDIKVKAEKKNPNEAENQNELAKELFKLGVFDPERWQEAIAMLDMMSFDGKELTVRKILDARKEYEGSKRNDNNSETDN